MGSEMCIRDRLSITTSTVIVTPEVTSSAMAGMLEIGSQLWRPEAEESCPNTGSMLTAVRWSSYVRSMSTMVLPAVIVTATLRRRKARALVKGRAVVCVGYGWGTRVEMGVATVWKGSQ